MTYKSNVKYHLYEFDIARNPYDKRYCMPQILKEDKWILDIGCGIGQTLIACNLNTGIHLVGIDVDITSLIYGKDICDYIIFINGSAHSIPIRADCFDLIISRVSLPYTNIVKSINEMYRILKDGGRIWVTLHPFSMVFRTFIKSFMTFNVKQLVFGAYAILNGIHFHVFQRVFPFPLTNKFSSFQTRHSIGQILTDVGFKNISINMSNHFIVTAYK